MTDRNQMIADLEHDWASDPRWEGVVRGYSAADVVGPAWLMPEEHTLARPWPRSCGTDPLHRLRERPRGDVRWSGGADGQGRAARHLPLGMAGGGDANLSGEVYPDQSLYPANSAPALVRRINALRRADQIAWSEGDDSTDWFVPIVADGEAGFGGSLNVFELTKSFIDAGAAGCTSRTNWPRRRSAGTWVARCSCPPASTSAR
jgi:isocitrate lyase